MRSREFDVGLGPCRVWIGIPYVDALRLVRSARLPSACGECNMSRKLCVNGSQVGESNWCAAATIN